MGSKKFRNVPAGATVPSRRYFISYSRGNPADVELARWLFEQLTAAQHVVFLDERQKLGTKWKDEIPREVAACDVFIVLVSDKSVHSEAVQEEVLIAREQHRATGRPLFAPIRVSFSGDLGYVMGMYLRSYQWRDWRSPADSPRLLNELLDAAGGSRGADVVAAAPDRESKPAPSTTPAGSAVSDLSAPLDLNALPTPGGGMAPDNPTYVTRKADEEVATRVRRSGETLVLLGPRQSGKSSLLNRYLDQADRLQKQFASVDLSLFDADKFVSLPVLLRELAHSFLHDLRLTSGDATAAIERVTSPGQMTWFVEDHVIQPVGGPLVLVIDEVDKVFEQDYRSDFFGMIRAWHNARTRVRSKWKQVDLVLAISTEPHLLMVDRYQSPFNVSPPIRLTWFELSHVEQLNARYGQPLPHADVVRLHEFLGGHPFLTHLALHRLSRSPGTSLVRFLLDATAHDGDFGPHLDTMLAHLHERPELRLVEGFQQIARYGQAPNDDVAYRLQAAGLVRRDNHQVVPSNELYARYFGSIR